MELTFHNVSTFYTTSTYVPTFIIVVIGYLVFFPLDDFNERIMVALTALLVEAAFFTQVVVAAVAAAAAVVPAAVIVPVVVVAIEQVLCNELSINLNPHIRGLQIRTTASLTST